MILKSPPTFRFGNTCSVEFEDWKCQRPVTNKKFQYCNAHYLQYYRGEELRPTRRRQGVPVYGSQTCEFSGCVGIVIARNYCESHYYQLNRGMELKPLFVKRSQKGKNTERNSDGEKRCTTCKKWMHEDNFGISDRSYDGLRSECSSCRSQKHASVTDARKMELRERRFNLPEGWFEKTLASQDGVCGACRTADWGAKGPSIDHDHSCCPGNNSCGKCVRGILCGFCNLGLGLAKESSDNLNSMIEYLQKWQTTKGVA